MDKIKAIIKKSCVIILMISIVLSDAVFFNVKKTKAEVYYQYLIYIKKPYTMQGNLKNTVDGIVANIGYVTKTEKDDYMQLFISSTNDVSGVYKNIVQNIDTSTLFSSGYHMRVMVNSGSSVSDTPTNTALETAKNMIRSDANSHRALYIYWDCNHLTDSSNWQLVSGATCQHNNQYKCTICGQTKSEGSTINHNYSTYISEATCQHPAIYKCTMCESTIYSGGYANHTWAQKTAATCTQAQVLYCTTCGTTTAGAGATGHNYSSHSVVQPTSVSKGYTRHTCVCGSYYDDTYTYKVEYNANGGYGSMTSQIIPFDKYENIKQNSFGRSYYYFNGWNTKPDGSGKWFTGGQNVINISTSTITLYAQWQKNKYGVTCVDCYEDGTIIDSVNNNKTIPIEYGTKISGEYFGTDTKIGAYYPGTMYKSCDGVKTVSENTKVKRFFKDYRNNGLNNAVINSDTLVGVADKTEKIIIPNDIRKIAQGALSGHEELLEVEIPNGSVNEIGESAFENCSSLKKIVLPYSVNTISKDAFKGCLSLEEIIIKNPDCKIDKSFDTIPQDAKIISFTGSSSQDYSKDNHREFEKIVNIDEDFFYEESCIEEFCIPEDVVTIGNRAFAKCENLKKIELGNVIKIGDLAFEGCTSLTYEQDFEKKQGKALSIPKSVKYIGKNAFAGDKGIKQIMFDGMDTIIEDKSSIDSETILGCYAESRQYDFARENKYKIVLMSGFAEDNNTYINEKYRDINEIVAIITGPGITKIGKFAFAGCKSLESVYLTSDLSEKTEIMIEDSAYYNCLSLRKVKCDENIDIKEINDSVFFNCEQLEEIVFANDNMLEKIGNRAFAGCKNLGEIKINNPNCMICEGEDTFENDIILRGWSKSTINDYSVKHGRKFELTGISYCVDFDKNGGDCGTEKLYAYNGMTMPSIEIPEKTGYTFCGYMMENRQAFNDCGIYLLGKNINISNDMTEENALKAVWRANNYSVEFLPNGADNGQSEILNTAYDEEFDVPQNMFEKKGYTFAGWSKNNDGSGETYNVGEKIKNLAENNGEIVKLYALWKENTYKVEYNLNGGTGDVPEKKDVLYEAEYIVSENKGTKEYYLFDGWNTRYDGKGTDYNAGQKLCKLSSVQDEVITLYAKWKPVTYSITYDLDGGEFGENTNISEYNCETEEFEVVNPEKRGYDFIGWSDGINENMESYIIKKGSHGDIRLKAIYQLSQYNIKFETNGGSFKDEKTLINKYKYGDSINLPIDMEKQNYIFKGWSTDKNSDKSDVSKILPNDTGDKVFYAIWTPESFNIKYVTDGGTISDESKAKAYLYGTGIELPQKVEKDGFSFAGWYMDEKCKGEIVKRVSENDYGDKVFYAKWIPDINSENRVTNSPELTATDKPYESLTPSQSIMPEDSSAPVQSEEPVQHTDNPMLIATPQAHKKQGAAKENRENTSNTIKLFKYGNFNKSNKSVTLKSVSNNKIKKAVIPEVVKYNGVKCKVTGIAAGAFKNCKQLKVVTIGKNIRTIGKNCFLGCKQLKIIKVNSLILKKVGKNTLNKTNKKLVIECKKKRFKKYKKMFKNKGNKRYKIRKKR